MKPQMEAFAYRNDPAISHFADDLPIVIFDGKCILCSSFVQFILRFDKHRRLRLLDGETPLGQILFKHFELDHVDYETIILLENGCARLKSDGAIRILEILGLPWSLAAAGRWLPQGPRDRLYEFIARNRYHWFGRRQSCYLPDPTTADRFIV